MKTGIEGLIWRFYEQGVSDTLCWMFHRLQNKTDRALILRYLVGILNARGLIMDNRMDLLSSSPEITNEVTDVLKQLATSYPLKDDSKSTLD